MKIAKSSLKLVENTVGKGEITHYEQFLLFPQCFQNACFPGASKGVWDCLKQNSNVKHLQIQNGTNELML